MGRIFETRKATMFARWNKMAKVFTRITKDIVIAVKAGGPTIESNPALRRAVQNARAANMPKTNVDAAIKRASGQDQADYQILLYEGFAPHGVGILVEAATDNVTRTVANVRFPFTKLGGSMGTAGSVSRLFERMGAIRLDAEGLNAEELELELIDHGLEEMGETTGEKGEKQLLLRCKFADFGKLMSAIEAKGIATASTQSEYIPLPGTLKELPEEQATEVLKLVDMLEQDDDVQHVFHNLA
ncbi:YebC/PmpR family DNA-binding transcriptional regulator [Corallococcus exiguus]|jgi:YebC/PmpR family DNA-binding regulatory protein|uniref:Probable transcriptional regulatory protein GTZ93_09065 n=1 Tax=Corallococcus exiguus TaxID=83462 RepID=A0A7Y1WU41_9BACT|nr:MULTISPECIES: YebC/PmpR family DNA-binding transcriptional regulator [Corallococcus]NBC39981.1 YebC/PmpR family DNA-binding transcriptional regulator [Corallococcus exiguus]NNC14325.1 YebC/PmpR family DNA-binding transcriptional regulator [Corallococcus exiguus]RKH31401.1 YebC/PmpR family DNA-binding transcriptional regulator [Corallococcus sp. CA041A]RKI20371.1 YebC/PmpR family DNA-binding transcriptional regulator [Corallococcus sp. AB030]RUO93142.1 YebC/PmpR family DNA-binding transcript